MLRKLLKLTLLVLIIISIVGIAKKMNNRTSPSTFDTPELEVSEITVSPETPNYEQIPGTDIETHTKTSPSLTQYTIGSGEYKRSVESDGRTRTYSLYVPRSYNPTTPTSLIMVYHGGGGTMGYSSREYGWQDTSDKTGAIIAFTNGTSRFPGGILATWNGGTCCGYARDNDVDDVIYTRRVVSDVLQDFNIKDDSVFAVGFSNGGIFMHRLACEASDLVDAVVAIAGTVGITDCSPEREIPIMHIHAIDDTHVLFFGGAGEDSFDDPTLVTEFTSVPDTTQFWITTYGLNQTPGRIYENQGAYCDRYTGSPEGGNFTLCVTPDGKHSWPGADSPSHSGAAPTKTLDGNKVIWDFFMKEL